MGYLYKIDFPHGKSYIGISSRPAISRFTKHCRNGPSTAIAFALRKYGKANATLRTLAIADDWQYLCQLEKKAIAAFNTRAPAGYNLTDGGEGVIGHKHSEATRAIIADKARTQPKVYGRIPDEATREKMATAKRGRKQPAEQIAKRVSKLIGRKYPGRTLSEETKAKISATQKGRPLSEAHSEKIRQGHIGMKATDAARLNMSLAHIGHKATEVTKAKMRAAHAMRKLLN